MSYRPQPIADLSEGQRTLCYQELADACGDDRIVKGREGERLAELMAPGELLLWVCSGHGSAGWETSSVLAALTDRRIVIINNRWGGGSEATLIELENVNRISGDNGVVMGGVTIQDGTIEHKITLMAKARVIPFVQRAREAVDARKSAVGSAAPGSPAASADDIISKLERLADLRDRGVISELEFNDQKIKLLSE